MAQNTTEDDNYLIVAAIDFGTTYSGYAFSTRSDFKKNPLQIQANHAWNAGSRQLMSLKAPTCLLLDSDKNMVAFGYEAENKYAELVMDEEHHDYYYFHRFKMRLYNAKKVSKELIIEDITGKSASALDIFSLSIKALKDHLLNSIRQQLVDIQIDDIRWVLTVPAIWSDGAKQFMRRSAEMAGISSNKLRIALEPEAASIYCQHLPTEKLEGAKGFAVATVGTKYMVVDLGGGTVDITVHEKRNDESLKEICRASGGDYGGTSVDREFMKMIENITGTEAMKAFKRESLDSYLDLSREFESRKRSLRVGKSGTINMTIPFTVLDDLCKEHLNKNFESAIESSRFNSDISIISDKIRIREDTFLSSFQPTIAGVIEIIDEILKREGVDGLSQIILVGGFAECVLLQKAVQSTFPDQNVIVPTDSEMAVLKGAVIFGHQPNAISERIAKYTYGFSKRKKFDPLKYDSSHLEIVNGEEKCSRVFDPIVKRNEILPLGKKVTSVAKCKQEDNGLFTLRIYQTEKDNPMYTDEDGCSVLGTITVQLTGTGTADKIKVELIFGETEIRVKIKETATHKKCEETIEMI
ncbi:heat shock 70 kDa protein 12A-like [Mytilus californianus]|uniref:heat shock 70 kDa protein 12A-like n=1 Tax=Mytilus californianus TaxID=6549 RepID=UPI0022453ABA|nr:heat shock 70 kDa protein 12A-like [Mytilus californianus]